MSKRFGHDAVPIFGTRDVQLDRIYTPLFRELVVPMKEDPGMLAFGLHLLFCAKNLERVGDHVANIAETVYHMVEGRPFSVPIAPDAMAPEAVGPPQRASQPAS